MCGGGGPVKTVSDVATQVFQPIEKAVVQPLASAVTSALKPVGVAIGVDKPSIPQPQSQTSTPAPAAPANPETDPRSDPANSAKGKLGRLKARGGLLIDMTSPVTGAANSTTGGLNIPN
jgi:hypothetical protein